MLRSGPDLQADFALLHRHQSLQRMEANTSSHDREQPRITSRAVRRSGHPVVKIPTQITSGGRARSADRGQTLRRLPRYRLAVALKVNPTFYLLCSHFTRCEYLLFKYKHISPCRNIFIIVLRLLSDIANSSQISPVSLNGQSEAAYAAT